MAKSSTVVLDYKPAIGAESTGSEYRLPSPGSSIGWRYVHCGGYDEVDDGVDENGQPKKKRLYHHFENKACNCPPGPQVLVLVSDADEIASGGSRGSLKSESGLAFTVRGNLEPYRSANPSPADVSYINDPHYKFLFLRKNAVDLDDLFRRAKEFYALFGGKGTENPMKVRFPSGAEGVFGHMEDGVEKWQGQEFTRMVIEEVTQIKDEQTYLDTIMSCRSKWEELRAQVYVNANPGGPGNKWFTARFVDMRGPDCRALRSGEKYTCPETGKTRTFIFSTVQDNPYAMRTGYDKSLARLTGTRRKQWFLGDFHAAEGQYFDILRLRRVPGEPDEALHVIPAKKIQLLSYWPRAIGVDWGYSHESAIVWGCWHPKEQLHIYREYSVSRTGTKQLGADIALKSLPDLEALPEHRMPLYLSPDAFARTDDGNTEAEQIKQGIEEILGNDAAFVMAPNQDEELLPDKDAWERVYRRQREKASRTAITIIRANNKRIAGWNVIRNYLQWWPNVEFIEETARDILRTKGVLARQEYEKACERHMAEVRPKILFSDACDKVITALEAAQEDPNNTEDVMKQDGDDFPDALRYLCVGFPFREIEKPREIFLADHLQSIRIANPGMSTYSLIMAARVAEREFDKQHVGGRGFTIPRRAGPAMRHWARRAGVGA